MNELLFASYLGTGGMIFSVLPVNAISMGNVLEFFCLLPQLFIVYKRRVIVVESVIIKF